LVGIAAVGAAALISGTPASAAEMEIRFTAADGVELQTTLYGDPDEARPTIVEFSPYGNGSRSARPSEDFNSLLVQIRGTGDSDGSFDALGPRTQKDVQEVLAWACKQPWSDGRLGLNGYSASAITIYNSLHQKLPCVEGAVMRSGTFELYRDLLYPGGISNLVPGTGVLALIGGPAALQGIDRLMRDPNTSLTVLQGMIQAGFSYLLHPTLDRWWRQRGFRGDVNNLPILMINGFFDVESRGAFQAFQHFRKDGAQLLVTGAHDGAPAGTQGGVRATARWFDHFVRGVKNGAQKGKVVRLLMSNGDREDYLAGDYIRRKGSNWPLPGTRWARLFLSPEKSGSANSRNDGSLTLDRPGRAAEQSYPAVPSVPTNTDPPNTAIIGGFGVNALSTAFPLLTEMTLTEPLGLSYSTAPLTEPVMAAGPAALEVELASTAEETGIWAVLSDVSPDGTAHPLMAGRLNSAFPRINRKRSLIDRGAVVQPYNEFTPKEPAEPGTFRRYRVELWPVGNRFNVGHRIRIDLVGTSAASLPATPGTNRVIAGGPRSSLLRFPVMRESDLGVALP
jgi:predicted acyl esterase